MESLSSAFLLLVISCLSIPARAALYNGTVQTGYGAIQGYQAFSSDPGMNLTNWKEITVWKGIPFAATTAGQNRFKAPQPATPWNSTLLAKSFSNVCPSATGGFGGNYTIDEDCLNLNIWSSANSSADKLPVAMWSYPAESTAADALFDGAGMADKGVVFVNYNYRTGSFGWLAHPELSEEFAATTGHNSSGNWGMLDQFAALKWIKANIAAFGGDPDHITVMGQSAGSAATYHIVNSPLTKDLIVGAIIESGVRDPHDPLCASLAEGYTTQEVSLANGVQYLASLNVSTIAQLRELPMSALITSFMGGGGSPGGGGSNSSTSSTSSAISFGATLDYYAMPNTYYQTLLDGPANDVPIMTGNTKDESGATYGLNISIATYMTDVNSTYNGSYIEKFLALYPAGNNSATASASENAQFTDRSKVGTWLWSNLWRAGASSPVYNYFWDHAPPGQDRGAYHESEINYVLNNLYATDSPWTDEDYQIATVMNTYWVNFIKTQNPNGEGLVNWNASQAGKANAIVQRVGDGFGPIPVAQAAQVKLFEHWFSSLPTY